MTASHLTAREKRARASAAAAVARAYAHTRPQPAQDDDTALGALYPYITHRRAAEIRREIQETRHARP